MDLKSETEVKRRVADSKVSANVCQKKIINAENSHTYLENKENMQKKKKMNGLLTSPEFIFCTTTLGSILKNGIGFFIKNSEQVLFPIKKSIPVDELGLLSLLLLHCDRLVFHAGGEDLDGADGVLGQDNL